MKSILVYIFIALQWTLVVGQESNLRVEIEKIIRFDTEIDYKKTPGFCVAIIDGDQNVHLSFGNKAKNTQTYLSQDDVFELGSITKPYISFLLEQLCADSLISLDDPVNLYMDSVYINPRLQHVTIKDLVNHSSGFPKRPTWFGKKEKNASDPYAIFGIRDLQTFYKNYIPDKKVKPFVYSHTNYALLELIISKSTDMSLEDAFQTYVGIPLVMDNTFFDVGENKSSIITQGYNRAVKEVTPWSFASFKGSEGLKSTPHDALLFINESMKRIRHGQSSMTTGLSSKIQSHHGWQCVTAGRTLIYTHSGQTSGHNVFYAFVPDTHTAVVVMANSSIGTEDLALQILKMINYNWRRKKVTY